MLQHFILRIFYCKIVNFRNILVKNYLPVVLLLQPIFSVDFNILLPRNGVFFHTLRNLKYRNFWFQNSPFRSCLKHILREELFYGPIFMVAEWKCVMFDYMHTYNLHAIIVKKGFIKKFLISKYA